MDAGQRAIWRTPVPFLPRDRSIGPIIVAVAILVWLIALLMLSYIAG
jgi:hypothetical protein